MTEHRGRPEIPSSDRFGPEVRRAALILLANASGGENSDLASAVAMVLERSDTAAILDFLAHLSFNVVSHCCGSASAATEFISDEIDVADFRITMPDFVDLDDPALTFPDIVRPT